MIDFHSQLAIIPEVYETATLQDNLEHSGGINISWKSATDTEIPLGAFVTYNGIRYILLDPYAPIKKGAVYYEYAPQFRHPQNMLDRVPFWIKSRDAYGEVIDLRTTSFTGFPHTIAKKFVDFFAEYVEETNDTFFRDTVGVKWKFNIPEPAFGVDTHAIISVPFDGCSIKSAADAIATAMGCNVFFDWNEDSDGYRTVRFVAGTTISGETYNCFHVLGGTTNMGKSTTSGSFAAVTQRLTLPDEYKGSIIDMSGGGIRLTKDLILDDIFPKMELQIGETYERRCYLTDDNGDKIVDHFEGDTPIYKTFAKWYVKLKNTDGTDYVFDQDLLILDQPLSLLFQIDYKDTTNVSKLVGRQFELTYFPTDTKEWDTNDCVAHEDARTIPAGWFRIAFIAEGETILPTTSDSFLFPQVDDKVTLINMALSPQMKSKAQSDLLAAANEIIALMKTPSGEYSETMHFDTDAEVIQIGQDSPFGSKHGSVVTNINLNLDTKLAEVSVGSWSRKTKTGGMADKVEAVSVSAGTSTMGGDNHGGSLGEGHYQPKTSSKETDTIRETVVKQDMLYAVSLSAVTDIVSCDSDGKVIADTSLYTLVSAYYGSRDVTDDTSIAFTSTLPNGVKIYQVDEEGSTSTSHELTRNRRTSLDGLRWLRVFIPKDTILANRISIAFTATHASYSSRYLTYAVNIFQPGQNMVRIDLDNESDAVACDSEGKPRFARTIVTKARIYDGNDVATSGVTKDTSLNATALKIGSVKPTISEVTNGEVTITWVFNTSDTVAHANKTISLKYNNRTYSAVFSLAALFADAIYQLNPSLSALNFVRKADNTFDPTERTLGLSLTKYDGTSTSEAISCPQGYTVKWAYDSMPTLSSGNEWTSGNIATIQSSTEYKNICIALYYGSILVDRETVPILKDGKHGENSVRVDLDNNNDTILYSSSKGRVSGQVTSQAHLYDGAQDKTSNTSWKITAASGVNLRNSGNPIDTASDGEYDAWITTSGMVYVNGLNAMKGGVTVQGTYTDEHNNQHIKYDILTLKKIIDGDKYDLVITPNAIAYNKTTDTPQSTTITIQVWKISCDGVRAMSAPPSGYKTYLLDGTTQLTQNGNSEFTYTSDNSERNDILVKIAKSYTSTEYLDAETIPVNKVENGKSVTKKSETYRYATNNSGTRPAASDSSWSTTKPTLAEGYWLYTETTITWSDDSKTVLYTDERNPNDGKAGQDIVVDGATDIKYSCKDSNTIDPSTITDWANYSDVTKTNGWWLWSKATTNYKKSTDGTSAGSSVNYNVTYIPKDGATGRAVKSITEYYKATNSSDPMSKPTSTSGWDTDPNLSAQGMDSWDANHKYLWNMEKVVYTESSGSDTTEYTIPQILAIWTKDGDAGRGIDSIVNKYKVTSANYSADDIKRIHEGGTGWDDNPTAPGQGEYLWNYEIINWTKGDTPTYTKVQRIGYAGKDGKSVVYDSEHSTIKYAVSSLGKPEVGREYPSDITSWETSMPTMQKGKYLWVQDTTAYNNGGTLEYTTTYGVSYWGTDVQIDTSRTYVRYSTQKTASRPDDNTFTLVNPPSLGQGDYLWILSQTAYVGVTDVLKSYSVSRVGTDGSKGDKGTDGKTTHFAYATSADGSQGFSTTNFSGATYIGTYRDQSPTDSTNYRSYTWTKWKGEKGDDAPYEVKDYAKNKSFTTPPTSGWDVEAPEREYGDYIWMRSRWFDKDDNIISSKTTYVCLTGDTGSEGGKGNAGRWYYYAGEYSAPPSKYEMKPTQAPYVKTDNGFYMLDNGGVEPDGGSIRANEAPGSGTQWTKMDSSHLYYITEAIFANEAMLGQFAIRGSWMISQQGTLNGQSSNAFRYFSPLSDDTDFNRGSSNFIPNVAICGTTGRAYFNNVYVNGQVVATSGSIGKMVVDGNTLTVTQTIGNNNKVTFKVDSDGKVHIGKMVVNGSEITVTNSDNEETFKIGEDGDVTFGGELSGASGTFTNLQCKYSDSAYMELTQNQQSGYRWFGMAILANLLGFKDLATIGARAFDGSNSYGRIVLTNINSSGEITGGLQMTPNKIYFGVPFTQPLLALEDNTIELRKTSGSVEASVTLNGATGKISATEIVTDTIKTDKFLADTNGYEIATSSNVIVSTNSMFVVCTYDGDVNVYLPSGGTEGQVIWIKKRNEGWCHIHTSSGTHINSVTSTSGAIFFVYKNGVWY